RRWSACARPPRRRSKGWTSRNMARWCNSAHPPCAGVLSPPAHPRDPLAARAAWPTIRSVWHVCHWWKRWKDRCSRSQNAEGAGMPVTWDDLTGEERTALKRMNRGPYSGLSPAPTERLMSRGLVVQRPGGPGISREGRELVIKTLLAARQDPAD